MQANIYIADLNGASKISDSYNGSPLFTNRFSRKMHGRAKNEYFKSAVEISVILGSVILKFDCVWTCLSNDDLLLDSGFGIQRKRIIHLYLFQK